MPLDLIFNASLGLAFALCGRDRLRADGPWAAPAFIILLAFVAFAVVPTTLYFYLAHPAWTWMYMVDPEKVPALAILPLLVGHAGMVVVGWYAAYRLIARGRMAGVAYAAGGGALLTLIGVIVGWGRLGTVGTYEEFQEGRALSLMDVKLGYVLILVVIGVAAASAFIAFELLRDSRRVRTR